MLNIINALIVSVSFGLVCRGQDYREVSLPDIPTRIYTFLELRDGTFVCGFRPESRPYLHAATRYRSDGKPLAQILPKGAGSQGAGNVYVLGQIAEDSEGALWFADAGQRRLLKFSIEGKSLGSTLLQMPGLITHAIDFSRDGKKLYLGGCNPSDRGPYQGCRSLVHRRSTSALGQTLGYLSSDRQKGWKATEKSHYRLSDDWIAVTGSPNHETVAYTNLSARRVWIVDFDKQTDVEIALDSFMPEVPAVRTPEEAGAIVLSKPLIFHLTSLGSGVFVGIKNQPRSGVGLIQIDVKGRIVKTWPSADLPGRLVGKSRRGHLVFEYGNRLRFISPNQIGKVAFK
jgi:hypothetical protein